MGSKGPKLLEILAEVSSCPQIDLSTVHNSSLDRFGLASSWSPPASCLYYRISTRETRLYISQDSWRRNLLGTSWNLPRAVAFLLTGSASMVRLSMVELRGARSRTAVIPVVSKIGLVYKLVRQLSDGGLTEGVNPGQRGGSHQGSGGSKSEDDGTEGLHFV